VGENYYSFCYSDNNTFNNTTLGDYYAVSYWKEKEKKEKR
jgi:hypothetical protein